MNTVDDIPEAIKPYPFLGEIHYTREDIIGKTEVNYSSEKLVTFHPELFHKQIDFDMSCLPKNVAICIITSIFNCYPYIFNYDINEVNRFIKQLNKDINRTFLVVDTINSAYNAKLIAVKYDKRVNKTIKTIKKIINKKRPVVALFQTIDFNVSSHAVSIFGYDKESLYFYENENQDILVSNVSWNVDQFLKNQKIFLKRKELFIKYYPQYEDWFDFTESKSWISREDYSRKMYRILNPIIGQSYGVLSKIRFSFIRDYIFKMTLIEILRKGRKLAKKDFSVLTEKLLDLDFSMPIEPALIEPPYDWKTNEDV